MNIKKYFSVDFIIIVLFIVGVGLYMFRVEYSNYQKTQIIKTQDYTIQLLTEMVSKSLVFYNKGDDDIKSVYVFQGPRERIKSFLEVMSKSAPEMIENLEKDQRLEYVPRDKTSKFIIN